VIFYVSGWKLQRVPRGGANAKRPLLGCGFQARGRPRGCYFAECFDGGFHNKPIRRSFDGANQVRHSFAFTPLPQNPSRPNRSFSLRMI